MEMRRKPKLSRELGLLALIATAVCTVIGGGINVLSVMIQRDVPGIAYLVPLAFLFGVIPALFGALNYAILSSAMPRAGGGYMYTSRALNPFLGFMATFSKWFGLSAVTGVIAYIDIPLLRDAAHHAGLIGVSNFLNTDIARIGIPLLMVWFFWFINLIGIEEYGYTVIILMFLMLTGGVILILTGFLNSHSDFVQTMITREGKDITSIISLVKTKVGGLKEAITAAAVLFFAYTGFATISQAGGEAKNPKRNLPLAFLISTLIITTYYMLFSGALYHAVPWQYISYEAQTADLTAPGLVGVLLPGSLAVFIVLMAAIALLNDIPPMLMASSRLFFAWAEDGIFPKKLSNVNKRFRTPHYALTIVAVISSLVILGCHYAGDFFLGIDITVTSLVFTYVLISVSVISFPFVNKKLYNEIAFIKNRFAQIIIAVISIFTLSVLFFIVIWGDVKKSVSAWYFHATYIWLIVMAIGVVIFVIQWKLLKKKGIDPKKDIFSKLPVEYEA
ncbi:MAG: APC family permease [Candidatus Aminicenantia bacterium]